MAVTKKSVRQASKTRTPSSTKKQTPSRKKAPASSKQETATRKKRPAPQKKGNVSRQATQPRRAGTSSRGQGGMAKTMEALNERLDIMLPEVMFRIAAIEHLLVKNQLCLYDELINARQFIQEQEHT
jgi:hypothetical protein